MHCQMLCTLSQLWCDVTSTQKNFLEAAAAVLLMNTSDVLVGDLQDAVNELTEENGRLSDEKTVLLESLCTQTEKLENARRQVKLSLLHLLYRMGSMMTYKQFFCTMFSCCWNITSVFLKSSSKIF